MEEPQQQQQVKVLFFTPVRVMDVGAEGHPAWPWIFYIYIE
jgi:hypothetical protein